MAEPSTIAVTQSAGDPSSSRTSPETTCPSGKGKAVSLTEYAEDPLSISLSREITSPPGQWEAISLKDFAEDHLPIHTSREIASPPGKGKAKSDQYGSTGSSTLVASSGFHHPGRPKYFHSRMLKDGQVLEKPWLHKREPREKWVTIIPVTGILVGLAIAAFLIYDGVRSVPRHVYCPVFSDDFSSNTLNSSIWIKEVQVGGFGNGQFDQTTNTDENVFIKDGQLVIQPTLQNASLIDNDSVINLLTDHSCTSALFSDCVVATNTTNGTIVNPAKSARLTTRGHFSIQYGRVEVMAKLPSGDWLWPAIWMLPVNSTYGPWPASGEIDIMESRGNNYTYPAGGNNIVSSSLHWGPEPQLDQWWRINIAREVLHSTYSDAFHTFGLEWSEKYIFNYIDTRLRQIVYTKFDKPFWQRGMFPPSDANGTRLVDPWSQTGRAATPFDQEFYLILNVAVGSTNGWFQDGVASKPWVDASLTAKRDFWNAKAQWYQTWQGKGQMVVKSVKMWQQEGYNGCGGSKGV